MRLASHQPDFAPYMGFFYKATQCDVLVLSDDVAFSKKGMHNWNRIRFPDGPRKLTLPTHAHHDQKLNEITVANSQRNLRNLIKTIGQVYKKAKHYDDGCAILDCIARYVDKPIVHMTELNTALITLAFEQFGIAPEIIVASSLNLEGHKDERILDMCDKLGADVYVSGQGAANYHQAYNYLLHGVELEYVNLPSIEYDQLHVPFIANLSVIDYVFNCGFEIPKEWRSKNEC